MKIFKDRNKELEMEIDAYLEVIRQSADIFHSGITSYLNSDLEQFNDYLDQIIDFEKKADKLLRKLVQTLYKYNLMPDLSTDILELMNALDEVSDISKEVLLDLNVEKYRVPEILKGAYKEISHLSLRTVDNLMNGVKAFFSDVQQIDKFVEQIRTHESEVDQLEYVLKCKIFEMDLSLCDKMHLRDLAQKIASLSDECEAIGDRLAVLKFKRTI